MSASLYVYLNMYQRQMVTASWFDDDGIQYSIPVNSAKPSFSASVYSGGELPLTKDKRLSLELGFSLSGTRSISYQNTRQLEGLVVETFDYNRFMADFWGDGTGDRFYSGKSGFGESITNSLTLSPRLGFQYRGDQLNVYLEGATDYQSAHYSLDSKADTKTWDSRIEFDLEWESKNGWEIETFMYYRFFNGYPEGYNLPYFMWEAGIVKNIKQFSIGFHVSDILNSTRNTRHITTENYVEDSMYNQLGRHFFITLKWNFGKLNAAQSRKANQAAMNMMF